MSYGWVGFGWMRLVCNGCSVWIEHAGQYRITSLYSDYIIQFLEGVVGLGKSHFNEPEDI